MRVKALCHCLQWFTAIWRNVSSFLRFLLSGNAQEKASDVEKFPAYSTVLISLSWRPFSGSSRVVGVCGFQGKRSATASACTHAKFMQYSGLTSGGEIKYGHWWGKTVGGAVGGGGKMVCIFSFSPSTDDCYCICSCQSLWSYLFELILLFCCVQDP